MRTELKNEKPWPRRREGGGGVAASAGFFVIATVLLLQYCYALANFTCNSILNDIKYIRFDP